MGSSCIDIESMCQMELKSILLSNMLKVSYVGHPGY
jgi:hypothetical protein